MNWLSEYFAQGTRTLNLSLWVYQPAVLGPDGPVVQAPLSMPYPGIELVYSPAGEARHGDRIYELPARYDSVEPTRDSPASALEDRSSFIREVSIFAPSHLNREAVIVVNKTFSFTPLFATDGTPGFIGQCMPEAGEYLNAGQLKIPWVFSGYLSI